MRPSRTAVQWLYRWSRLPARASSLSSRAFSAGSNAAIVLLSRPISFARFGPRVRLFANCPCICSSAHCRCSGCHWSRQRTARGRQRPAASALVASRPFARAMAVPRSATSLNGVSDFCALAGGACMRSKVVLIEQRLIVGAEIRRRDSVFVGPAYFGRKRIGKVFVGAHHVVACKVERLSRQVRQPLTRTDLCAPLAQDRLELVA